jgi:hypothetical protein
VPTGINSFDLIISMFGYSTLGIIGLIIILITIFIAGCIAVCIVKLIRIFVEELIETIFGGNNDEGNKRKAS